VLIYVFHNTTEEKRDDILSSMREKLRKIREALSRTKSEEISRYMQYQAEYYVLQAHRKIDVAKLDEAIKSYEEALSRYNASDLPVSDRVDLVKQDLNRLREIRSRSQYLIPKDRLESRHLQLRQEVKKRAEELKTIRGNIEREVDRRSRLKQRCDSLKQEIERYEERTKEFNLLKRKIRQHEAGLQFFITLPQAAMAPLWVEVVRLALEQGEIDSLVRQAVERLSLQFPEEALPLLAEIAARTPGSFSIDQEVYQACTGHWMGKIAEARRLKEEGKIRAAAKTLVDAWDAYFDALGGEVR
jgi:chromosome segregation ATPase